MLKKTIKYTDYNGEMREEDFFFNLSKAELTEMQLGVDGGMTEFVEKIIKTRNTPELMNLFKEIILKSYGEKSLDGKRFIKIDENGKPLSIGFSQTEAYSELYMELATNSKAAADFINGIIPVDLATQVNDEKHKKELVEKMFGKDSELAKSLELTETKEASEDKKSE